MDELTPRERQVTALLLAGLTLREIAGELDISPTTVQWFVQQIGLKFPGRGAPIRRIRTYAIQHPGELDDLLAEPTP